MSSTPASNSWFSCLCVWECVFMCGHGCGCFCMCVCVCACMKIRGLPPLSFLGGHPLFVCFLRQGLFLACNSLIQLGWHQWDPEPASPAPLVSTSLGQQGPTEIRLLWMEVPEDNSTDSGCLSGLVLHRVLGTQSSSLLRADPKPSLPFSDEET